MYFFFLDTPIGVIKRKRKYKELSDEEVANKYEKEKKEDFIDPVLFNEVQIRGLLI